ncbi:MAG: TOMM precursor leader peptide-binding protein [Jatrophihabitans sp.]|uniref:TOMM precursor leader peptide-binding protein n=1 Tax=Jatrophihabitans sp. TaxID=1932789 RepID=UPI003F80C841
MPSPDPAARFELAPATRMLWRDAETVQFECGDLSVVVDGLTTRTARSLTNPTADPPDPQCTAALHRLAELGLLWRRDDRALQPVAADGGPAPGRRAVAHPTLAGELTALSTRSGHAAGDTLRARGDALVSVHGTGRVGPAIGAVLGASGVGRVEFTTDTDVKTWSTLPGGVLPDDAGQRLAAAARAAVRRATPSAPGSRTGRRRPASDGPPDLAVLALDTPVDDDRRDALQAFATPHLLVALAPTGAVVGPLVLPGLTACLRCLDHHRRDRDEAWPRLAVQLGIARRHGPSSEVAVATMAAGLAAAQVLTYLDGGQPATLEGTLELHPPDWRIRRRSWPVHPTCGCVR